MLARNDLIAFVATTDMDRARPFYGDTLGLKLLDDGPYACAYDANGTMLRVTLVPELQPAGYTVCGWRVDDMATTIRTLTDKGVEFTRYDGMDQDELGAWAAPGGAKVAWFSDPDGNTLSLTQFP